MFVCLFVCLFFFWGGGGGCLMRVGYISKGKVSLFSSIFPFWNARFQKFKNFCLQGPHFQYSHFHIFRFKMDARLQVDIDYNTESKFSWFSCSSRSFFSPVCGPSKPTKSMKQFFFYPFGGFRGPFKPSSQKSWAFWVNVIKHGSHLSKLKMILL